MARDDLKRACEAVGWVECEQWSMGEKATWWSEPAGCSAYFASFDDDPIDANGSALALLEATSEDWSIRWDRVLREYSVEIGPNEFVGGPTLPEAVVGAVLSWKDGEKP